jgi:hypothetical protein
MRSVSPLSVLGPVVVALALLVPAPGHATTLVRLELDQMIDMAEGIFTGTAVFSEVVPSQDGKSPFTFVTFDVESVLKGVFPGRHVTLRLHGGTLGDTTTIVHGMPEFGVGETYLVFVHGNGVDASPVLGWVQGQYQVVREALSGKPILVDWKGAPILGIAGGRFERGRPQDLDPDADPSPGAVVLSEEGVEVRPVRIDAPRAPDEIPGAAQILRELETFVRSRSGRPSFAPGRQIVSAHPSDVPERVGGSFTATTP